MNKNYLQRLKNLSQFKTAKIMSSFFIAFLFLTYSATANNFIVNSLGDSPAVTPGAGTGLDAGGLITLRSAVQAATATPGTHTISFSVTGTINLTLGQITLGSATFGNNITITGPGSGLLTVNQTTANRIFSTGTGQVTVSISGIGFTYSGPAGTTYSGGGGAIVAGGANASTTIDGCNFTGFNAQIGNGGAISASSAANNHSLFISNCTFTNNKCGGAGGAVSYNGTGTATITGCTFTGNKTGIVGANVGGGGGAINTSGTGTPANGGTYLITKCTFINNGVENATAQGGAIINTNGTLTATYNRFVGNTAATASLGNTIAQTGGTTVNTINANDNWWSVNGGPDANAAVVLAPGGSITKTTWLQLKGSASPATICNSSTSTVTASFLNNSAGTPIAVSNLTVLIGLPISFVNPVLGTISAAQTNIQANGKATATFTPTGADGNGSVNAVVDNIPNNDAVAKAAITIASVQVTNPATTTATVGTFFSQNFSQINGAPVVTFSTTSTLPNGITLSSAGLLSGTPTQSGSFPINVKATSSNGCNGTGSTYTLIVGCPVITVTNPLTATGQVGTTYGETFSQSGGIGTVNFTTTSVLPGGLTLVSNGVLSGVPNQSGNFPIVVVATDENNCTGTSATYNLVISCASITVVLPLNAGGQAGVAFSESFGQTGGTPPVTYSTASALPNGLTLTSAGLLSGIPTEVGTFTINISAVDSNNCPGSAQYILQITCPAISMDDVANQVVCNGLATAPVVFTGTPTGLNFKWTNDNTSIGLAASGTGDIASFVATNLTNAPVTATITVTPDNGVPGGSLAADSVIFNNTGALQTWTVPAGVTAVNIECLGAQGGNAAIGGTGGLGGSATGTLAVTPGQILNIYVGGQNGFNGGGTGAPNGNTVFGQPSASNAPNGGGASDVRVGGTDLTNRVIVAGGGGGAGENGVWPGCQVAGPAGNGGAGGGLSASDGTKGVGAPCNCGDGGGDKGTGGSQVAGGAAGGYQGSTACLRASWTIGSNGTLGLGGNGSLTYFNGTGGGGGGGGGYFGGGSGGSGSDTSPGGGAGGGSSFIGGVTGGNTAVGVNSGNGLVKIFYDAPSNCSGPSKTFTITVNPVIPINNVIAVQPDCITPTGSIIIDATPFTGDTLEYSIDNGSNWQSSDTFNLLVPATYNVAVRKLNSTVCYSYYNTPVIIDAAPTAPVVNSVTVDQPNCDSQNGTITIDAAGSGTLEYSVDTTAGYQTNNSFTGLIPGTSYNVYVRLQSSTTCVTAYGANPVLLNNVPALPVINSINTTQPTCTTTGTIIVNATGPDTLVYAIDGVNVFQLSDTFYNVPEGTYKIRVALKNSPSCEVLSFDIIMASSPITAATFTSTPASIVNLIDEHFDAAPPVTWLVKNNSAPVGPSTWSQGDAGIFAANSGAPDSYVFVNYASTTGDNTISNWLIAPSVIMNNGDEFSFYTRTTTGSTFPDRLQVRMSTSGSSTNVGTLNTDVGDFGNLLLDINPTYTVGGYPENWTKYTVTVSGLSGPTSGRMAFRYFVENGGDGPHSNYIGIDDAVYTGHNTICSNVPVNLQVNITGGTANYTVVYNDGTANQTVNNYSSGADIPVSLATGSKFTLVSVTDDFGCSINSTDTILFNVIPVTILATQPTDTIVCLGAEAKFTIAATGSNLTYQWFNGTVMLANGGNISGVTTSELTISNVSAADTSSNYHVEITGDCGDTSSVNVALILNGVPVIDLDPADVINCQQHLNFNLSVHATGAAVYHYEWQFSIDNGLTYTMFTATDSATITATDALVIDNGLKFRCIVFNDCGADTSAAATLYVANLPAINALTQTVQPTCTTPTGEINITLDPINFSITDSTTVTSNKQKGRISRDQVPSSCETPKAVCPGAVGATALNRYYNSYVIHNPSAFAQCVTVSLKTMCGGILFHSAYLHSFDPNDICANYLADAGRSSTFTQAFNANIPAGDSIVVVVNNVNVGQTCSGYELVVNNDLNGLEYSIDGINWLPTPVFTNLAPGDYTVKYRNSAIPTCTAIYNTIPITINPAPVPATVSPVGDITVCDITNVNLTFASATPGTVFNWTNDNTSIGLAAAGAGSLSFTAALTAGIKDSATVIVTPSAQGQCAGIPDTFKIFVNALVLPNTYTFNSHATGVSNDIYKSGCELIAKLIPAGTNPVNGNVTSMVWIEPTLPTFNTLPFVQRHYQITPDNDTATATGRVTLYFKQSEFDAFNAFPPLLSLPVDSADAAGKANLRVTKYPGISNDGTGLPGSYTNGVTFIDPVDNDIVWNTTHQRWEVTFDVTGFSGFIIQTNQMVLPVSLLSFNAQLQNSDVKTFWKTTNEINNNHFELERSLDGRTFNRLTNVAALNGAGINNYNWLDAGAALLNVNKLYYRLKMVSATGTYTYSNIVVIPLKKTAQVVVGVMPNPFSDQLSVSFNLPNSSHVNFSLMDAAGKLIRSASEDLPKGFSTYSMKELANLPKGVYLLTILYDRQTVTYKVVKK